MTGFGFQYSANDPPFLPADNNAGHAIMGIDPGVTGGVAFLFATGMPVVIDIPTVAGQVDVAALARAVQSYSPRAAVIEHANAFPGQGVSSVFKFGAAYGDLRTMVTMLGIPLHFVHSGRWKNHFKLDRDKEKSRALAKRLWPACVGFDRKKDHGRAEAALIARYGIETISALMERVAA